MSSITVLLNDNKKFDIDKKIIAKYKLSLIYGYLEENPGAKDIKLDICYDDFKIIHSVITNKVNQFDVSSKISTLLNYLGFVDDELYQAEMVLNEANEIKHDKVKAFLDHKNLFIPGCIRDYMAFKKIFADRKSIVPIQIVMFRDNIVFINIYDGIPIFVEGHYNQKKYNTLKEHGIKLKGKNDINNIRQKMLFTGYNEQTADDYSGDDTCFITGTPASTGDEYDDNITLRDKYIYSSDEIMFVKELIKIHIKLIREDGDDIIDGSHLTIPQKNMDCHAISYKLCDKVCEIIDNKSEYFSEYYDKTYNDKQISTYAYHLDEFCDSEIIYIDAYFGFVDISSKTSDFIDNESFLVTEYFDGKKKKKLTKLKVFLDGNEQLFLPASINEYSAYKKIFANKKNIISIQIIMLDNNIKFINIYDGIPIYFTSNDPGNAEQKKFKTIAEHGIVLGKTNDVNHIRHQMLFTGYNEDSNYDGMVFAYTNDGVDSEGNDYKKGDTFKYRCNSNCYITGNHAAYKNEIKICDEDLYSPDEIVYVDELIKILTMLKRADGRDIVEKEHPITCQCIDSNAISIELCDEICAIINKKLSYLRKHHNRTRGNRHIHTYTHVKCNCDYLYCYDINAYFGFVNISK